MCQEHIPWDRLSALYPDSCLYLAIGVLAHHNMEASTTWPWKSGLNCPIPSWHDGWKFLKQWDNMNPSFLWILLQEFCQGKIKVINGDGWEYLKVGSVLLCDHMILYLGIYFRGEFYTCVPRDGFNVHYTVAVAKKMGATCLSNSKRMANRCNTKSHCKWTHTTYITKVDLALVSFSCQVDTAEESPKGIITEGFPRSDCPWPCLSEIVLIDDWCRRFWPTADSSIPRQESLSYIRKVTDQEPESVFSQ